MFEFLWDKKPDKIKRQIISQKYENGGLKMIDIYKFINSLKTSWIKRILDDNNKGMWKLFYNENILKFGGKLLFECNLTEKDIKINFPHRGFLKDILIAWSKVKGNAEQTNIGKEIIWNNSKIKVQDKTLYKKKMV